MKWNAKFTEINLSLSAKINFYNATYGFHLINLLLSQDYNYFKQILKVVYKKKTSN